MSKLSKNPANSKSTTGPAATVVVAPLPNKQRKLNQGESEAKTRAISSNSGSTAEATVDSLPHPQKKASIPERTPTPEVPTDGEAAAAPTRAPRDPHGHKLIKVPDVLEAGHKTKYLPLGDGSMTYPLYFQPMAMRECNKNWCEMEMFELINGSQTSSSERIYSIDAEDLLKMCYLHAMAQLDLAGEPRLHYEQWVLSVFQEYCASSGTADYTERGAIARTYLDKIAYSFKIGGPESRLQIFFQKRCIRDLGPVCTGNKLTDNANIVTGKSAKAKFEYQIEGFIMSIPEGQEASDEMALC